MLPLMLYFCNTRPRFVEICIVHSKYFVFVEHNEELIGKNNKLLDFLMKWVYTK